MSLADQALTQLFANAISSASLLLVGFVDNIKYLFTIFHFTVYLLTVKLRISFESNFTL